MRYVAIIGRGERLPDVGEGRGATKEPVYHIPAELLPTQFTEGLFITGPINQFIQSEKPVGTAIVSYDYDGETSDRLEDSIEFDGHHMPYDDRINLIFIYTEQYLDARSDPPPVAESAPHELNYGI